MSYSYTRKEIIQITAGLSWGLLGFKRGMDDYNYSYQDRKQNNPKEKYLYSTKIYFGMFGTFIYLCPLTAFISIPKEIYRLEVNLRGLESEKNTKYYKNLI